MARSTLPLLALTAATVVVGGAGCGEAVADNALDLVLTVPAASDDAPTVGATLTSDIGCPTLDDAHAEVNENDAFIESGGWRMNIAGGAECTRPFIHGTPRVPDDAGAAAPIALDFVVVDGAGDEGRLVAAEPAPVPQPALDEAQANGVHAGDTVAVRFGESGASVRQCTISVMRTDDDDIVSSLVELFTLSPESPVASGTVDADAGGCAFTLPASLPAMEAELIVDFTLALDVDECAGFMECNAIAQRGATLPLTVVE